MIIDVNPDIMGKVIDITIMVVGIINQNITEVIGVHGENLMTIEDIIIVHTKEVIITDKMEVSILNLKTKMVDLFSLLEDN